MAHSADLTYDRLAWASTWYLREETLKAAVAALVNFQYRQPLAQHWGGGTLSSSDGQRFPVRGKVRNASALPRYFGYGQGITFYTWSSDQFAQYGTKVISSTVRDATYVLDAILDNETDLTILEHTTDTAGYTDLVFCLFDLLGMQFSPRLRDIGDRQLYKLKTDATIYPRLDARLTGRIDLPRLLERMGRSCPGGWLAQTWLRYCFAPDQSAASLPAPGPIDEAPPGVRAARQNAFSSCAIWKMKPCAIAFAPNSTKARNCMISASFSSLHVRAL